MKRRDTTTSTIGGATIASNAIATATTTAAAPSAALRRVMITAIQIEEISEIIDETAGATIEKIAASALTAASGETSTAVQPLPLFPRNYCSLL